MTTLTQEELRRQLLLERQTPDRDRGRVITPGPPPPPPAYDSPQMAAFTELVRLVAENVTTEDGRLRTPKTGNTRRDWPARRRAA